MNADEKVVQLAQALLREESVTPEPASCLSLIADYLANCGFLCERLDSNGVANLVCTWGDQAAPTLGFAGHVDVVPASHASEWKYPPFSGHIDDDGVLWGRGAADMKGALAAMVVAAAEMAVGGDVKSNELSLALLITSDEEGPATDGTIKIVDYFQQKGRRLDWCVVGEPSCNRQLGDTLRPGRRGSLTLRCAVEGRSGHVAYPERGNNAAHRLTDLASNLMNTQWDNGYEAFPPTSCQITTMSSDSGAENVVPGSAFLQANWRFNPASMPESIQAQFAEIVTGLGVSVDAQWTLNGMPFSAANDGELVACALHVIEQHTGVQAVLDPGGGTSDGRFIAAICDQIIEFGPLNETIHQQDEHVAVADIQMLRLIYRDLGLALAKA